MTLGDDDDDDREDDAIPPPRPRTPRPFPPRTRARRPSVSDARRLFARRRRTLAGRMGTTSSAPARDSRGDLRQRAAQQAQQPRYTMPQGYANAPQPFQGQQNYAAPRYYGQVRAHPPAVPPENPPRASRRSRVTSRKRVTAWCFFWSRHRGAQAFDSRRETRGRFFSSTRPLSNAPTRLFRLFRPFDEKKT